MSSVLTQFFTRLIKSKSWNDAKRKSIYLLIKLTKQEGHSTNLIQDMVIQKTPIVHNNSSTKNFLCA